MFIWGVVPLGLLCLLQLSSPVQCVKFLVTVQRQPRYDAVLPVTVAAVGVPRGGREFVTVRLTGASDGSRELAKKTLEFTKDGFDKMDVVLRWKTMQQYYETAVKLIVENENGKEEKSLVFGTDNGYIFIQTDKPIYTPRQTVRFRIIAVDEYQLPAKHPIKVDIKNPGGIIVDRMRYSTLEAFKAKEFELPREATQGIWSISASLEGEDNSYITRKEVKFEVKEYVLPRFSAELKIDTDVVTKDTEWISLFVSAKYVYGQPVQGSAEIQLGVFDKENGVQLLPGRYTADLEKGRWRKDIRIRQVLSSLENFPARKKLYVALNVTELATRENDTVISTATYLAHPYYMVKFDHSDQYFRPGFPFTLKADVRAKSGQAAAWTVVYITAVLTDYDGKVTKDSNHKKLVGTSSLVYTMEVPGNTRDLKFIAFVLDLKRATQNRYEFQPKMMESSTNEYLHISLTSPIKRRRDGRLLLRYTKPFGGASTDIDKSPVQITIQILTRGIPIYTTSTVRNNDGRSSVKLPKWLYRDASPSMRVVAYYPSDGYSDFIADSLLVDTTDTCVEEIGLTKPGGLFASDVAYKPKEHYELKIRGKRGMKVGLAAVDEAVLLLRDKQTLTRESFFEQLQSHDQGDGEGDGKNLGTILTNSGLEYLVFDPRRKAEPNYLPLFETPDRSAMGFALSYIPILGKSQRRKQRDIPAPDTVRRYFPESWLFTELELPRSGRKSLNLTLPDSITTWNFMAVSMSRQRGVCVSSVLKQQVQKLFFADVRLPYKVTRLEEVKVKIAIYNYQSKQLKISGRVTGLGGLCFSANSARGDSQDSFDFEVTVGPKGVASQVVKVIPLRNGEVSLLVDLLTLNERDVVEKKLFVVAEGLRVRKSITFVLDPEAKHMGYQIPYEELKTQNTATINNIFDVQKKEQNTTIDLALPEEVIRGTERCEISAFGDLMGDIITHAVVESRSLVDQPVGGAEEVLGDLGPTVHALIYVNQSGLADTALMEKGRRFITHSVARLLKYREHSYFKLQHKSKPATWLTATILKTLCHASKLAFIDKEQLIDSGFNWLAMRVDPTSISNPVEELDGRLKDYSFEYTVMLQAEILIAQIECGRQDQEGHLNMLLQLERGVQFGAEVVEDPLVIAKAAYALMLYNSTGSITQRLWSMRRENEQGHTYWSIGEIGQDSTSVPVWYRAEAHASAIEATAYALMVFLKLGQPADSIADWLVGQRNHNGAFVGAMDSMAAIQALSYYSRQKHGQQIDLTCNVSSNRPTTEYKHSFKFTLQNATSPEAVNNVPLGHKLEVLTKGHGLGQMQVNVEYNVPIEKNSQCRFNVTVDVQPIRLQFSEDMQSNPLCSTCGIGCDDEGKEEKVEDDVDGNDNDDDVDGNDDDDDVYDDLDKIHRRDRRSLRQFAAASKRTICIHVCLNPMLDADLYESPASMVELEMLSGYHPVPSDVERIQDSERIINAEYVPAREVLFVYFTKLTEQLCFALRATDEEEVGRPTPASVVIKEIGQTTPSCSLEYNPVAGEESLQVFCADFSNNNRGECRCFSGICSACLPLPGPDMELDYHHVKKMTCASDVTYEVDITEVRGQNQWVEIDATVLSLNKTGSHAIETGDTIQLITPSSCHCPHYSYGPGSDITDKMYLLSPDVERMVDRTGKAVFRYLLDEKSRFLRVAPPEREFTPRDDSTLTSPAVPFTFLKGALIHGSNCEN